MSHYLYSKPKVYIVILNYNSWKDTAECVKSVLESDYKNLQVVVLDNNSPDNSLEYLKKWAETRLIEDFPEKIEHLKIEFPIKFFFVEKKDLDNFSESDYQRVFGKDSFFPLVFIQNGDNRGFAAGNNVFLRFLLRFERDDNPFVFLLNPDTIVKKDTIAHLVKCGTDKKGIWGVRIFDYFSPEKELIAGGFRLTDFGTVKPAIKEKETEELDFISGSAMFTSFEVLKMIGLLPENYFLYWEDADWCTRAKEMGVELYLCEKAIVYDKGGVSVGGRTNMMAEYYYTYNIFKYYKKYFPDKIFKLYFFVFLRGIKKLCTGKIETGFCVFRALFDVLCNREPYKI